MARIADKHGLTNRYRQVGTGKRVVKRGRPRKHLLGSSPRRKSHKSFYLSKPPSNNDFISKTINLDKQNTVIVFLFFVILLVFFSVISIFRCIIPIVIGSALIFAGDKFLKKLWKLSDEKWKKPASLGWTFFTCLSMCVSFFIVILIQIEELHFVAIIITAIVYLSLSFLILFSKHQKFKNNK